MVKSCNVENCTRFSVTQWMIGVTLLIMLGMQTYIINRVDKIELTVKELTTSVYMFNSNLILDQAMTINNEKRLTSLENSFDSFFLKKIKK